MRLNARKFNRELIYKNEAFVEIYVNTLLEKCEKKYAKGLYQQARNDIKGSSDSIYEETKSPKIIINYSDISPKKLVYQLYERIFQMCYIGMNK